MIHARTICALSRAIIILLPAAIISVLFFVLPIIKLFALSMQSTNNDGIFAHYGYILTNPVYLSSIASSLILSLSVTAASLIISVIVGLFLTHNEFPGKQYIMAILSFPLALPGIVIGFFVIMLGGRQGLASQLSNALFGEQFIFAYSVFGLFVGYLYFSIPRVILTITSAMEKLDNSLIEAAQSLRASPLHILKDITLPALKPALIASSSLCFATSMGAFGTAFALGTDIHVLPIAIYSEFTIDANFAMAAALSIVLGIITWVSLYFAHRFGVDDLASGGA